ncbi:MAG: PAS domain-containing protein, partial [Bacteroidia bacterium]|nr:PAS domain-containing protein [Bacteroidia bacterium]
MEKQLQTTQEALQSHIEELQTANCSLQIQNKELRIKNEALEVAYQQLFQKDEMLVSLLESNTTYLARIDTQSCYTYVNQTFCDKFGFTREQLIGRHYAPTVHPQDLGKCEKAVGSLYTAPNQVVGVEIRKPNPQGGYFDTHWEFVAIRNPQGEILEVQAVGRDITAQKKAWQMLREEHNRLELLIWGGRLATWDWHLETNQVKLNERWSEILSQTRYPTNLDIQQWENLIHPDDRDMVRQGIEDTIMGKIPHYEIEFRALAENGSYRWLFGSGKVIDRDESGQPQLIGGIFQDISEKQQSAKR